LVAGRFVFTGDELSGQPSAQTIARGAQRSLLRTYAPDATKPGNSAAERTAAGTASSIGLHDPSAIAGVIYLNKI
jgi:hypothetical protein